MFQLYKRVQIPSKSFTRGLDSFALLAFARRDSLTLDALALQCARENCLAPESWIAMALHYQLKGDHERAIALLDRALSYDRRHIGALRAKAAVLGFRGKESHSESVALHRSLQALAPNDLTILEGLVDELLATDHIKPAYSIIQSMLEWDKRNPRILLMVGKTLSKSEGAQTRQKAATALLKALAINDKAVECACLLARLLCQSKQWSEAENVLTAVLRKEPQAESSPEFLCQIAEVYLGQGKLKDALKFIEAAERKYPLFPAVQEMLRKARGGEEEAQDNENEKNYEKIRIE
jgi:tetratricopeptide (TPR) repeat protein